ncbi:MAG: MBL fold metallo-hydrolase [archaeon]|nr:MBL fold metallo-hydrolase [archaeon]
MEYTASSGKTSNALLDPVTEYVAAEGLAVDWILETHPHADHLTGAAVLKSKYPGSQYGIGEGIKHVAATFHALLALDDEVLDSERYFDRLFKEGDTFQLGSRQCRVLDVPGHTPACVAYYFEDDAVFIGDTLFMPDQGSARCDFPKGSAATLWDSTQRLLALPEHVRVFVGHDYGGVGAKREMAFETTVGDQKRESIHVKEGTEKDIFIRSRTERDATLAVPNLLFASIQVNIRGGQFPPPEKNGVSYLKTPLNVTITKGH